LGVVSIDERGRNGENEHPHLQTTDPRCINNFANVNRVTHRYFPGHPFSNGLFAQWIAGRALSIVVCRSADRSVSRTAVDYTTLNGRYCIWYDMVDNDHAQALNALFFSGVSTDSINPR
jgi:hypothetical protein